jgi:uncharacterized protein (DUF1015 family)
MVSIQPVSRALVAVDSAAAQRISAPNYDEFQSDREAWELLRQKPDCVLRITMPHCHVDDPQQMLEDGSEAALEHAASEMKFLLDSPLTRTAEEMLWVYEIVSPLRPEIRQIGLGGYARTADIRTDKTPRGTIIRNEGIRPDKAEGRARLIAATHSYIGTVNCAVRDAEGRLTAALTAIADSRDCDYEATGETGDRHRVWFVVEPERIEELRVVLGREPAAYVADGNHRSAAAAQLGREHFLAVFFPTDRLHLEPYNRLFPDCGVAPETVFEKLRELFDVQELAGRETYRPDQVHEIGLYHAGAWYRLIPGEIDSSNAAASIDAAIVQQHILSGIFGLHDPRDSCINYVGGNRDAAYLRRRVDEGDYAYALSLAPVTMEQFIAVCEQGQFMPPKSTWFDPKIRSGLVIALLE